MSSYYNKTAAIIAWAERTQLPPQEFADILQRRARQSEEYFMWCATNGSRAVKILVRELALEGHKRLSRMPRYLRALELEPAQDFFVLAQRTFEHVGELDAAAVYESGLACAANEFFEVFHEYAHYLTQIPGKRRFADNPYPFRRISISDSDRWLREKYPDEPWERNE